MKYICLCGHHGAGKTHIALQLNDIAGWPILDKRESLKRFFRKGWLRRQSKESWESWYRSVYERFGSGVLMLKLLETNKSSHNIVIVDAVHTSEEWSAIQAIAPASLLVGVWAPTSLRSLRRDEPPEMDVRRVRFWHNRDTCLMAAVEWAFPGTLSRKLLDRICREFIGYVNSST